MNNIYIKFSLLFLSFCLLSGSLLAQTVIPVNPSSLDGIDGSITVGTAGYNKEVVRLLDSSSKVIGEGTSFPYEFTSLGVGNYTVLFKYKWQGDWYQDEIQISLTYDVLSDYCNSYGDGLYETGITSVQFNTIDNSPVTSDKSGFEDFTSISTRVEIGNPYNLLVNLNTDGGYTVYAVAWIDWNANNSFNDDGERYDLGFCSDDPTGPTSNSPLVVNVPTDAVLGPTRMRISAKYDDYPYSCEKGFDGEVEDYTLNVVSNTPKISGFEPEKACVNTSANITISGENLGDATEVKIGGVNASIKSKTETEIIVNLPNVTATCEGPVTVINADGSSGVSDDNFMVNTVPEITTNINGELIVSPGTTNTYTCPAIVGAYVGATGYEWAITGDGATITNHGTQVDILFDSDATPGDRTITVKGKNDCEYGPEFSYNIFVRPVYECQTNILNWDFDEPDLDGTPWRGYSTVNGWYSSINKIEIWGKGMPGVEDGNQICELNSDGMNEMWQNVETTPGVRMFWSINYKYRDYSSETIELRIGNEETGRFDFLKTISNDAPGWKVHYGYYTVPSGQDKTQFRIVSIKEGQSAGYGNLIDDINFYSIEVDVEPPVLGGTLPSTQIVSPNASCEFELVDYTTGVTATDNCDTSPVIAQEPVLGTIISANTEITITATDAAGNSEKHKFTVELKDDEDPTASNPEAVAIQCIDDVPDADITVVTDEADNCTTLPVVTWVSDSNNGGLGSIASPYIVTRTYSVADDAKNNINVVQTITVIDKIKPKLICPDNIVTCATNEITQKAIVGGIAPVSYSDNCGIKSVRYRVVDEEGKVLIGFNKSTNDASGYEFPEGISKVTYKVVDKAGNRKSKSFTVTVKPKPKPIGIFFE